MGEAEVGLEELKQQLTEPGLHQEVFDEIVRRIKIIESMAK